ncbi:MAG: hypothetical protein RR243_16630, partial [Citrobacter sp.]
TTIKSAKTGANQREQDLPVAILILLSPKNAHNDTRVPDVDKDSPGQPRKIPFPRNLVGENNRSRHPSFC